MLQIYFFVHNNKVTSISIFHENFKAAFDIYSRKYYKYEETTLHFFHILFTTFVKTVIYDNLEEKKIDKLIVPLVSSLSTMRGHFMVSPQGAFNNHFYTFVLGT